MKLLWLPEDVGLTELSSTAQENRQILWYPNLWQSFKPKTFWVCVSLLTTQNKRLISGALLRLTEDLKSALQSTSTRHCLASQDSADRH
jgi:hypothetical protein